MLSKRTIIIIAIVAAVAILATTIVLIAVFSGDDEPSKPLGGVYYDPSQGEYEGPEPQAGGTGKGVLIPGFGTWTIPPQTTKVNTKFYNPEKNEGKYDLKFEVRVPNNSEKGYEVIYTSGLVKPGNYISKVTLSRGFAKGEYDATLHVQPYTADDSHTPLNIADINFKLIVK